MISVINLILLLIAHFIGDFVCQGRKMADNKSKNMWWLLTHGFLYTTSLFLFMITQYSFSIVLGYSLLNGVIHMIVDKISSTFTSKHYKNNDFYEMFCVIGADQMIHGIILVITAYFILK